MNYENEQQNNDTAMEQEVFLRMLMANRNRIFSYILTLVPNWNDAEDIIQDTTAAMWRKNRQYQGGRDFAAWGCGVARYEVLNFIRKRKGSKLLFDEDLLSDIAQNISEDENEVTEMLQIVHNCVGKLKATDRDIVKMRYKDELSVKEISLRIGRSLRGLYRSMARVHGVLLECVERTLASQERDQ